MAEILIPGFDSNFDFANFNYTMHNYTTFGVIWTVKPSQEVVVKTVAMTILFLVSIGGNAVVLYIIARCKSLHTATNFFIFNLALADLLNISYSSWSLLASDLFQNFVLGPVLCRLNGCVDLACMIAGVFSLVVISVDRFLGIVHPFSTRISKRRAIYVIIGIWLGAIVLASPPFIYRKYRERQWADHLEIYCKEDSSLRIYWIILLVLLVWVPLVAMTTAYFCIRLKIKRYEKIIIKVHNYKQIFEHRKKVIQTLYIILVVFCICWAPFQILILYRHFRDKRVGTELPAWYNSVFFAAHYVALANCAINPFIYGTANVKFRSALRSHFPLLFEDEEEDKKTTQNSRRVVEVSVVLKISEAR